MTTAAHSLSASWAEGIREPGPILQIRGLRLTEGRSPPAARPIGSGHTQPSASTASLSTKTYKPWHNATPALWHWPLVTVVVSTFPRHPPPACWGGAQEGTRLPCKLGSALQQAGAGGLLVPELPSALGTGSQESSVFCHSLEGSQGFSCRMQCHLLNGTRWQRKRGVEA